LSSTEKIAKEVLQVALSESVYIGGVFSADSEGTVMNGYTYGIIELDNGDTLRIEISHED